MRSRVFLTGAFALAVATSCTCPPAANSPSPAPPPAGSNGSGMTEPDPGPTPDPAPEPEPEPEPEPAPGPGADPGGRVAMVPADHPLYGRVEGIHADNACTSDTQCVRAGCSREVCSATSGVSTTCEVQDWPTAGGECGCVAGQCVWYRSADPEPPAAEAGAQGKPCGPGDACQSGLTCKRYYGVAGARGPQFTSCEIPCAGKGGCPAGQRCIVIADGPGQVCRP